MITFKGETKVLSTVVKIHMPDDNLNQQPQPVTPLSPLMPEPMSPVVPVAPLDPLPTPMPEPQPMQTVLPPIQAPAPSIQSMPSMPEMGGTDAPPPPPGGVPVFSGQNTPPPSIPVAEKKKFPKKIFLIIAVLILVLGLVGGVLSFILPKLGGGLVGQNVTLTWWGLWEDESTVSNLISQYQQAHPNVKINYIKQSKEDYRERLTNSLAQGRGPDIFRIHNTWVPMFANELEPMPASVYSPAQYQQLYYPTIVSDMTLPKTGKIVGIPLGFDTIGLYINQDIFESYAKAPPTTWDEFRSLAKELTIKDASGIIQQSGAAMGRTENVDNWQEIVALLMMQNRVKMNSLSGPLAEAALDFYTRFSRVDGVWNSSLPPSTIAFASGKVAMYIAPSWRIHEIKQQNPSLRFEVIPVPQLPKENDQDPDVYYSTYWAEGVWAQSKGKKEAWDFLKFISSPDSLQTYYQAAVSGGRLFGEPYPRIDMQELLVDDPIVGTFVSQGDDAKSWYLASRTFDGASGINSKLSKYFEDAVNGVNSGTAVDSAIRTLSAGVAQVLSQYGLSQAPAAPAQ